MDLILNIAINRELNKAIDKLINSIEIELTKEEVSFEYWLDVYRCYMTNKKEMDLHKVLILLREANVVCKNEIEEAKLIELKETIEAKSVLSKIAGFIQGGK